MEETAQTLTEHLLPLVVLVLTPVASGLGVLLYRKVASWLNVQVTEKQEHAVKEIVGEGVAFATQAASKWARDRQKKTPSQEKLEAAVGYVVAELQRRGLPELARDSIVAKIEAELGAERLMTEKLPVLEIEPGGSQR